MADREKVIKGLEMHEKKRTGVGCLECPYAKAEGGTDDWCIRGLHRDILALLKEQESEWLEDSDPGQEYGTTWACRKCAHSIHEPYIWNPYDSGYKYCPHCGAEMKVKLDE